MEATRTKAVSAQRWVEVHADVLYRHALFRVGHSSDAEDLVQDTLVAAWKSRTDEEERDEQTERAWLVGILRHKVVDYYRRQSREPTAYDPEVLAELEDSQFDAGGWPGPHWSRIAAPGSWSHTEASLHQREFFEVLRECTDRLPETLGQAFVLRELDGCEVPEICSTLGVNQNNLFVMLHRARLALRRCLELKWFGRTPGGKRQE